MQQQAKRIAVTYHVASEPGAIETRARAIAVEQSVELPPEAIGSQRIERDILGQVASIRELHAGHFEVRIELAADTMPPEAGQIINMTFGNSSLQPDVTLHDIDVPAQWCEHLPGPRHGLAGLRAMVGAGQRAMTATALKPQGLSAVELAQRAGALARGGLDIVKDDHGLADQVYSPFAARVAACSRAVAEASAATGRATLYAPSLWGSLDDLRRQIDLMREAGLRLALAAPMVIGLPAFAALAREATDIALMAHPSMAGASRIAPPLLIGKLFRLLGADAVVFPNHGGRFSYSPATCRDIARRALEPMAGLASAAPTPAGGMTLDRIPEILDFYGRDCILLIGGSLLSAPQGITAAATSFSRQVEDHGAQRH